MLCHNTTLKQNLFIKQSVAFKVRQSEYKLQLKIYDNKTAVEDRGNGTRNLG